MSTGGVVCLKLGWRMVLMEQLEPLAPFEEPSRADFYRALGRAIKVTRAEQGLERKELSRLSGVSYPYLSEIEKGKKRPSTEACGHSPAPSAFGNLSYWNERSGLLSGSFLEVLPPSEPPARGADFRKRSSCHRLR